MASKSYPALVPAAKFGDNNFRRKLPRRQDHFQQTPRGMAREERKTNHRDNDQYFATIFTSQVLHHLRLENAVLPTANASGSTAVSKQPLAMIKRGQQR